MIRLYEICDAVDGNVYIATDMSVEDVQEFMVKAREEMGLEWSEERVLKALVDKAMHNVRIVRGYNEEGFEYPDTEPPEGVEADRQAAPQLGDDPDDEDADDLHPLVVEKSSRFLVDGKVYFNPEHPIDPNLPAPALEEAIQDVQIREQLAKDLHQKVTGPTQAGTIPMHKVTLAEKIGLEKVQKSVQVLPAPWPR